ncbi:MAG: hypothetical protein R3336_08850, partial [Phycisphaeraceae bacterium]|nr:hypothetical protein [Phycisphaeraceae bacterium]
MKPDLPEPVAEATEHVFAILPFEESMAKLVVDEPVGGNLADAIAEACESEVVMACPPLAAGLWLYGDDLERSHTLSQGIDDQTGSFWHGIMHRREGDFSNSHYWFRQTGDHPAMAEIEPGRGVCAGDEGGEGTYDGHAFIDAVERAHEQQEMPVDLVEYQRREWAGLFNWSARNWSGS